MKVAIFGMGSIGQRQARILSQDLGHELLAYRSGRNPAGNGLGIGEVIDFEEVLRFKPQAAFITNPTNLHLETALRCAAGGMHLFIEKPLSHSLEQIDELEAVCRRKGLTAYVAYGLRFHPVIKKLKELAAGKKVTHARVVCSSYLPEWRRQGGNYSSYADQGGGVLLDLSHEFDYIHYILGPIRKISGKVGRVGGVTVDAEDFADLCLLAGDSVPVNLYLNIASHRPERYLQIDLEGGYLYGDLLDNRVDLVFDGKKDTYRYQAERDDYLREQARYFFANLGNPSIMNDLTESRKVLEKILEFKNGKR